MGEGGEGEIAVSKKDKKRAPRRWKVGLCAMAIMLVGCGADADVAKVELQTAATAVALEIGGEISTWDTWEGERLASPEAYGKVVDSLAGVDVDGGYFCSATVVKVGKKNAILSVAYHCIENMRKGVKVAVVAANGTWNAVLDAKELVAHGFDEQDLGAFRVPLERIEGDPPEKSLKWDESKLEFGEKLFEVGLPTAGNFDGQKIIYNELDVVSPLVELEMDGKKIESYQAESMGVSAGGSSGGPVSAIKNGEVVMRGIVSTGMLDDEGKMRRGIGWLKGLELLVQVLDLEE